MSLNGKILLVAGARPNFMKIAPLLHALENNRKRQCVLIHTGQHYDFSMSGSFFSELGIRRPDYSLEVGSGSHAHQTSAAMTGIEEICQKEKPEIVVVVGDVNSTVAAALAAKKLQIRVAHVEAGLRSGDRRMPEEINRLATDAITDIFFTTERGAGENLIDEGHNPSTIHFVGHVMIDTLYLQIAKLTQAPTERSARLKAVMPENYFCLTMHRPSNVDDNQKLEMLLKSLRKLSQETPILFPCHPRTRKRIEEQGFLRYFETIPEKNTAKGGLFLFDPLSYAEFLFLWKDAAGVITDSGGLQEETTALKVPCITLRENTERPITVTVGSNELAGCDPDRIVYLGMNVLQGKWKISRIPELWDGKSSERIADVLLR